VRRPVTDDWLSFHSQFRESLVELAKTEDSSNGVVATLAQICRLYGLWSIEENAQYFLKYGFFNGAEMDKVSDEVSLTFPIPPPI
jgi:acyl-CoA oxidase